MGVRKINERFTSDCMRVIATLFVFCLHARIFVPGADSFPQTLLIMTSFPAWAGVWIFFLLSGYSIGYGFFTNRYNLYDAGGKLSLKKLGGFYARRFLKIAPLYYLYCAFFEIVSGQRYLWENPAVLLRMLTFTYNGAPGINGLGHLWYISIAMQLYLIMPIVYLLLRSLPRKATERLSLAAIFVGGGGTGMLVSSGC